MLFSTSTLMPLELLLNTIIKQYLASAYCVTIISETPLTFSLPTSFIFIIPNEENLVQQIFNVSEMGCSDYIVRMQEPQNFMTAYETVVHKANVRRSDRKIIFLPYDEEYNEDKEDLPAVVLSMKGSAFVPNILMIENYVSNSDCKIFDLLTHQFVGPDDETHLPKYLDRWDSCSQEFENHANLFPHDMTNLYGKTLKVACFTYKPYVLLDIDTAIEPLGRDGVEIRIVDEFCRWINCTVEIVREDVEQWGEIFKNESGGIGVLGSVLEDKADVGISALYSWYEEYRVMDFSVAGVRTAITCIAPAPRLLSSLEMPLMPFTWYMWLAVAFTYFYAATGILTAQGCTTTSYPFLNAFGMMIGQSQYVSALSRSWKIRSVTGWLLIAGLILSCAYGAGLASTFTVPKYESSIDTVNDIVDRKIEWGATHDAWIFSLTLSTEPLVKQLVDQFRIYSFDVLKEKSFTRSMAYSIEKLPAGNFAIGEYVTQEAVLDMMLMLEDFYYEQCVVMMRKSSPYTEKVSQLLGRLHQSGLLLAWETQVALKHLNYKVQVEVRLSRSKNDVGTTEPLNLGHVVGIFIVYAIGLVVSIATFLGELYVHHRRMKNEFVHFE